jgi:excinuclease UvrABC nuclease subunit
LSVLIIPTFKEQIRGFCGIFKDGNQVKKSIVILISKQSKVQMILHRKRWFIVVTNAFRRKEPLPNLIIIDGGKGQLSSALKV